MKRFDFIRLNGHTYRVIELYDNEALVIDCFQREMPKLICISSAEVLDAISLKPIRKAEELTPNEKAIAIKRLTMISGIITSAGDKSLRNRMIERAAEQYSVSKQTLRAYLREYLIYQDIAALAPKEKTEKSLTQMQKNMRWGLNKFFYNQNKNSLSTAYTMLIKAKYTDDTGNLLKDYPTFYQFRYFYRTTKKLEKYYISREGIKDYQMNERPLLGDGVQSYAPTIGTAMLDGTVCDIYLINDAGQLVGRPLLVVACDANTSLCLGYSLLWEGGTYSLVQLLLNIISDKNELCTRLLGREIDATRVWNVNELPLTLITDVGREYAGETFEQVCELGITIVNLPPYRAELKGVVEKFFDLVQESYKKVLKGKGVIMPDFQKRGSHDYRKDAILTMNDFEKIVARAIVYYNSERVIENYPFTEQMLKSAVRPYASDIWNYRKENDGIELVRVSKELLVITLLPRAKGQFTRVGLKANGLRYAAEGYKEKYLSGGSVIVAYDPDNCNRVWLKKENGEYEEFKLIESRFANLSIDKVNEMKKKQRELVQLEAEEALKAKIELMAFIETITEQRKPANVSLKNIRKTRIKERNTAHKEVNDDIERR